RKDPFGISDLRSRVGDLAHEPAVGARDRKEQEAAREKTEHRPARAAAGEPVVDQDDPTDADHRAEPERKVFDGRQRAAQMAGLRLHCRDTLKRGMKKTASKRIRTTAKPLSLSRRTRPFGESVIREMTRMGADHGGVNLAQGLPDFEPPRELLEALPGILAGAQNHQYSYTWGSLEFRRSVAEKCARFNGMTVDPDNEVTITCGVSEALVDAVLALTEPGDEVVILEPWYEN